MPKPVAHDVDSRKIMRVLRASLWALDFLQSVLAIDPDLAPAIKESANTRTLMLILISKLETVSPGTGNRQLEHSPKP